MTRFLSIFFTISPIFEQKDIDTNILSASKTRNSDSQMMQTNYSIFPVITEKTHIEYW